MNDPFDEKVRQQVVRLRSGTCHEIEREVSQKRIAWIEHNCLSACSSHPVTPRQAYETLFFAYMGLKDDDVPVVSQTSTEIVWRSYNPCPTLEACKLLGMDTRQVCRSAYEKSTQAFLSALDPQLRFLRSYQEIRPYADYCLEWIVRVDFEEMMEMAIQEALISRQEGNKGYGTLVILGKQVIGKAHDTVVTGKDPSQHAELNAIWQACQSTGDSDLSGAILFSTCEPCPMCASLAASANLTTIVYGISIDETARMGKSRIQINSSEVAEKSPVRMEIIGGVLKERCRLLYH